MADSTGGLKLLGQALLLLVVGGAIAGGGYYLYQDATQASENAVEMEGTVISSTVESKTVQSDTGRNRVYYVDISYRYTVDGERYTSDNLCPGAGSSCDIAQNKQTRNEAADIAGEYPADESVTVYVPPNEPTAAFLVQPSESSTNAYWILVGFGALLALLGVGSLFNGLKTLLTG